MSKHGAERRSRRFRSAPAAPAVPSAPATVSLPVPPPPPVTGAVLPPPPAPPGTVRTMTPITAPPPVVPRPQVSLVPSGRGQRRVEQREQRRRQRRRISIVGGAVVGVLALAAGVFVATHSGGKKAPAALPPGTRTQHTVLLSIAPAGGAAIESVLVAHDSASGQAAVVLVPSDIVTEVAGHGSMLLGNAATFGAEVPGQTLSDMLSVTVDGDWILSPQALAALVDHVGGIVADVPIDISSKGQIVVEHGNGQQLTGAQAAALATYIGNDEPSGARLARFQTVFSALVAKLGTDPKAVAGVIGALSSGSSMGRNKVVVSAVLAGFAADLKGQNAAFTTLPTTVLDTGDASEKLVVDGKQSGAMVEQYFKGSVPVGRVAGLNRVIVLNGTGALGLGQSARERLTEHGLVFIRSANQPGFGYKARNSVVLIPDTTPTSLASGRRVAAALGLPTTDIETSLVDTNAADVIVIIGRDYKH